jgi:DNA invertase Pin-like site-specific DNA recombinase
MTARTILYGRVSTTEQTVEHQKTQAEAAGYQLDRVVFDHGISGVTTKLREREGGKRLFDLLRPGDTLVVRWIDRLGRDYSDVTSSIRAFMESGVVVRTIINNMIFDGSTNDPMQKAVRDALIAFMAATAEAQAEATREAQKAGIAYAQAKGGSYLGRKPTYNAEMVKQVLQMKQDGQAIAAIAKSLSLTRQTIYRILENPSQAIAITEQWESANHVAA